MSTTQKLWFRSNEAASPRESSAAAAARSRRAAQKHAGAHPSRSPPGSVREPAQLINTAVWRVLSHPPPTPPLPPSLGQTFKPGRLMMSVHRQSCPQNSARQLSSRVKQNKKNGSIKVLKGECGRCGSSQEERVRCGL